MEFFSFLAFFPFELELSLGAGHIADIRVDRGVSGRPFGLARFFDIHSFWAGLVLFPFDVLGQGGGCSWCQEDSLSAPFVFVAPLYLVFSAQVPFSSQISEPQRVSARFFR